MMTLLLAYCLQDAKALDAALDEMAAAKDAAAYTTARAKVLAMGDAVAPLLKDSAADWSETGWVRSCAAESCRLRLTNAALAAEIDAPSGLDPATYKTMRNPTPHCLRDFVHRGKDAIPLLVERWRWTMSDFRFSAGDDGKQERQVFERAIVDAAGQVNDSRAQWFLAGVVNDANLSAELRGAAATSFGMVGGAMGTLTAVIDDNRQPLLLREGCALGLGRYADAAVLDAIKTRLAAQGQDPAVIRALLTALGNLGSSWGWESRGASMKTLADQVRAGCSDLLVAAMKDRPEEAEVITRALQMVAWPASVDALKAIGTETATKAAAKIETTVKRK